VYSVVDWHCFDADPDFNFSVNADPDPNMDLHQNDADPLRILPLALHMLKNPIFFTYSRSFSNLQFFTFLIIFKDVIILSILDSILKFCGKRYTVSGLSIFAYAWQ
jgi:hypothetical protein